VVSVLPRFRPAFEIHTFGFEAEVSHRSVQRKAAVNSEPLFLNLGIGDKDFQYLRTIICEDGAIHYGFSAIFWPGMYESL